MQGSGAKLWFLRNQGLHLVSHPGQSSPADPFSWHDPEASTFEVGQPHHNGRRWPASFHVKASAASFHVNASAASFHVKASAVSLSICLPDVHIFVVAGCFWSRGGICCGLAQILGLEMDFLAFGAHLGCLKVRVMLLKFHTAAPYRAQGCVLSVAGTRGG